MSPANQEGRFMSVDPLAGKYPFYTPYQYAGNRPIIAVDIDGLEGSVDTSTQTQNNNIAQGTWKNGNETWELTGQENGGKGFTEEVMHGLGWTRVYDVTGCKGGGLYLNHSALEKQGLDPNQIKFTEREDTHSYMTNYQVYYGNFKNELRERLSSENRQYYMIDKVGLDKIVDGICLNNASNFLNRHFR